MTWNFNSLFSFVKQLFSAKRPIKKCFISHRNKLIKFSHKGDKKIDVLIIDTQKKAKKIIPIEAREGYFDNFPLHILDVIKIKEGILLFYYIKSPFVLGAVLYDKNDPSMILWRTANPIFQHDKEILPLKLTQSGRNVEIHFKNNHKIKFSLNQLLGKLFKNKKAAIQNAIASVKRSEKNPIIEPILTNVWECCATFNAAAVYLDHQVHFLYRAIGSNGMSVLGYAASKDGIHIDKRLPEPAYFPREPFEFRCDQNCLCHFDYSSGGGGWGGCEDPRLTQIDDTLYMTYTAFNGIEAPGVALTSISVDDFLSHRWDHWEKPVLISPRGEINKNWSIFPEKINGKFAILHSISPMIAIDYFDSLDLDGSICIHSVFGSVDRNGYWDNQLRGSGPPPIKTDDGWLVLYHAMDKCDPNRYKLGAMMLDLQDPTQINYRAINPILEPDAYYENVGYKSGVIYCCGAVVINDQLFVYYGGADRVACVATAKFSEFLHRLKNSQHFQSPKGIINIEIIKKH